MTPRRTAPSSKEATAAGTMERPLPLRMGPAATEGGGGLSSLERDSLYQLNSVVGLGLGRGRQTCLKHRQSPPEARKNIFRLLRGLQHTSQKNPTHGRIKMHDFPCYCFMENMHVSYFEIRKNLSPSTNTSKIFRYTFGREHWGIQSSMVPELF